MNLELWRKRKKELKLTFEDLSVKTGLSVRTLKYLFTGERTTATTVTEQVIEKALGLCNDPLDNLSEEKKIIVEMMKDLTIEELLKLKEYKEFLLAQRK